VSKSVNDLFQRFAIPPSPLHEAIQKWARKQGWTAPWDEQQREKAGKRSGVMRKGRAEVRRHFVKTAFERLKPPYRMQPFSDQSIDALTIAYRNVLAEDGFDPDALMVAAPFKASRETLINDLKALGIRSKLRVRRSG